MYKRTKRHPCFFLGLFSLCALCVLCTQAYANKSGVEPGVLSLPSGPGSLGGIGENVQANLNMGLMSYQIKVVVPQGRGSATPNPSITYSSSAGSGIVGIGWNFSAGSSIERSTVRGLPTYTNEDLFYGSGELVKIPGGPFYRARYEGSFMRYRWVQKDANDQRGYWIAEAPDGSKMYYGANSKGESNLDAQVYGLKGTFRWELVTKVDRNGNRVEYSYFKEGAQTYPDQIAWVFDANDKPLYHLKFGYEDRPDFVSDGKPGFDLQTTKRLKEVQITSNGTRFRSYHFDFEDSTGLSRLIKVTRYGSDPKLAYPVQFSMKYSDAVFSPDNSRMVTMPTALGVDFRTNNIDFIDINGDGLPDVVDTSKAKHLFFMNQLALTADLKQDKHDFPSSQMRQNPTETSAPLSNPSVQMLDYNGDGFTDLVDAVNKKIYINKGNSQWENSSASLQNFPVTGTDPNMRFFDYNGDKAIDVISSDGSNTTYWVSDGKGNWKVTPGNTNIGLGFASDKLKLIDINGDGLQDIVHITKNSMRYRKYLGYGEWTDWIDVKVPGIDQYELSTQAQFNDINGDGMADMVAFLGNSIVYFVNKNGTEFSAGQKLQTFKGVDLPDSTKTTVRIVDINGNGSRDIVYIDSSGKVVYVELFGKRPNLMTEISNGIGQRINVEYGSSVYFYLRDGVCDKTKDAACSGPWQNKMPMPFNVVTKIATWASRESKPVDQAQPTKEERPQIQTVYYHNGFYDGVEKKFRGFRHVETLYDGDESVKARKDEIKFDVGDTDPYRHGKLLERMVSDDAKHMYRSMKLEWGDCPIELGGVDAMKLAPPIRFICQTSQETKYIEGEPDASKWRTTRAEMTYDGFGNVILSATLGEKDKTGDEKYIKKEMIAPKDPQSPTTPWLLRAVQKVFYCESPPDAGKPCAEIQYFYDGEAFKGLPLGEIRKGNLTRLQMRRTDKDWVTSTRRKYDTYGNIIAYKGLTEALREVEWDDVYHRFSVKETIRLSNTTLEASSKWDYARSKITSSVNYNGHISTYSYDTFGRLLTMGLPGDPADKPSVRYIYEMQAPISRIVMERRIQDGGPFVRKQIECYDGLGRKLQVRQHLSGERFLVAAHIEYNRLGQHARIWKQYEGTEACSFVAPKDTPAVTKSYDGFGRMLQRVNEDGTTSRIVHLPLRRQYFDEEDNHPTSPYADTPMTQDYDGLGRIIQEVDIPKKGQTITKKFAYTSINAQGKDMITSVTFDNGSQKEHVYDLLGNVTKIIDPDRTEMRLEYDDANLLVRRIDGRGKTLVYTYDELGRMRTVQEEGKPETKIETFYDTPQPEMPDATNLKGQVSKTQYPGGAYLFSYSDTGLSTHERHIVFGVPFDFKNTFDRANAMLSQQMPDGRTLSFQYDTSGRMLAVKDLIPAITYHPSGSMKSWEGANGIRTTYNFDSRERIKDIEVKGKQDVFKLDLTLDSAGNITKQTQTHGAQSFENTYQYDAIYRLTQASLDSGKEILTYTQDAQDNILSKTSSLQDKSPVHLGEYTYDPKRIHQATKVGKRTLQYDGAGNVTQLGDLLFQWDHLNRTTEVQREGKVVARHWYDNSARRVIKEESGLHTFYIHKDFIVREGAGISYLRLDRDRAVSIRSNKISAIFFDDIGGGKADGQINAGDAWSYYANQRDIVKTTVKPRPFELDLTTDMLQASLSRMLDGDKEVIQYHHIDHLGNIRAVTDSSGNVIERKHYYPYGKIRKQEGQATPYGYMGAELDQATQTNRFLLRSLAPTIGRWLSPDPAFDKIGGPSDEFNSYGLVTNNPIRFREIAGAMGIDAAVEFALHNPIGQTLVFATAALGMFAYGKFLDNGLKTMASNSRGAGLSGQTRNQRIIHATLWTSMALTGFALTANMMFDQEGASNKLFVASYALAAVFEGASLFLMGEQHKEIAKSKRGNRAHQKAQVMRSISTAGYLGMTIAYKMGALEDKTGQAIGMATAAALFVLSSAAGRVHQQSLKQLTIGLKPVKGGNSSAKITVEAFDSGVSLPEAAKRRRSSSSSRKRARSRSKSR